MRPITAVCLIWASLACTAVARAEGQDRPWFVLCWGTDEETGIFECDQKGSPAKKLMDSSGIGLFSFMEYDPHRHELLWSMMNITSKATELQCLPFDRSERRHPKVTGTLPDRINQSCLSDDGQTLYFVGRNPGSTVVLRMDLETRTVGTVTSCAEELAGVAHDSRAKRLLVSSPELGTIFAVDLVTGERTSLVKGLTRPRRLAVDSEGAVVFCNDAQHLIAIKIDSGTRTTLVDELNIDSDIRYYADMQGVVIADPAKLDVCLVETRTGVSSRLFRAPSRLPALVCRGASTVPLTGR